jgi:hypothetical protein
MFGDLHIVLLSRRALLLSAVGAAFLALIATGGSGFA